MAHRLISPPTDLPPAIRAGPPSWRAVAAQVWSRPLAAAASVGLLLVVGVAAWWLLRPAGAPIESVLPVASRSSVEGGPSSGAPAGTDGTSTTLPGGAPELVVQAAGEVVHPGLYRLAPGARVDDLIRAAGGLTRRADRDRLNVAAPLEDGERMWIPARGEEEVPDVVTGSGGGGGGSGASGPLGEGSVGGSPIDLNTADAAELDTLPGIGPATASAILAYRDQSGPFAAVEDLLEVRGIGEAKLEQLRPLVRV